MYIKDQKFSVQFSKFAERHFCKMFLKKYKNKKWTLTRKTIVSTLERAHAFSKTDLIDSLKFVPKASAGIFKLDFRVAGTDISPKKSGNRVIFYLCNETKRIEILLVYSKDNCPKATSETKWIFQTIKNNFPEFKHLIKAL